MQEQIERINSNLEAIALEIVTMEVDDIPTLGNIFNGLCDMEEDSGEIGRPGFSDLLAGLKIYLEKVILRETDDFKPFEQGFECLQSFYRCIRNEEEYGDDISGILNELGFERPYPTKEPEPIEDVEDLEPIEDVEDKEACEQDNQEDWKEGVTEDKSGEEDEGLPDKDLSKAGPGDTREEKTEFQQPDENLNEEDLEILSGFVMESLDNLDEIEVSLIDLEQDPNNSESINAIFRSFHTIKGVSSFINLMRINKLAHGAENLLDKVRAGEIAIQETIIDIILESVDLLKKLIIGVQDGLEKGTPLDICIDIAPLVNRIDEIQEHANQTGGKPVGEILVQKGSITQDNLENALEKQQKESDKKIGEILIEEKSVDTKQVVSALRDQKKYNPPQMDLQVKVDTKKLDSLVDLTGELVIAQSMLRQNSRILSVNDQKLAHNLGQLNQITSALQTTAMSMRMVPIKATFQKMVRLIRDLAKNSGKKVQLKMSGEDTEIDRNVVEELYEPMVHMIRNSADHGIEVPEERKKAGKNEAGEISLRAYHKGGNIVVEIADDGKGLDRDRIIEKAKANNLITDESKLSESEICNMIFQPGFSTAKQVTDVSGRGVGMDVVKKAIDKLRGRVEISTLPGKGSTFFISLPLTLAIIEGMLVRVGEERYVIPALVILESFRPDKDQYSTVKGKGEMILFRDKLIPLVRLTRLFSVNSKPVNPWESLIVAVEYEDQQMGLLLDELLGKEEVVIKSLGETMKDIKGIAGAAIMGDGRVGLILDMAGLWDIARDS